MRSASDAAPARLPGKARLALLLAALTLAAGAARAEDLYVICNSGVSLQAADVRDVFIGEKGFAGSVKLAPADNASAQAGFLARALKLDALKYSGIWTKKSFRDGANPPPVKASDAEAVAYVRQTPGGCSYVTTAPGAGVTVVAKL
ncbi:MAG: phosphate ABC transporter substrate-binding protein [Proteobacteria bacterium]|nr:phosphate ABC transporter substrate-binding protein [Pseudomonadota bacterium]